eukprot:TRINITY_DN14001_c0_g1_i2.p2 TRINITY_DN14001_c0_g1~~TRINITY_DN14001_c0_g1_i2.p2  ORF type:complete len:107 (-),score=45.02 TRINITY_DN14001_c0_g1_i2:716-1036(-)
METERLRKQHKEVSEQYSKMQHQMASYKYIADVLDQGEDDSLEHMKRTHSLEQIVDIQAKTLTWRNKEFKKAAAELQRQKQLQAQAVARQVQQVRSLLRNCVTCAG